MNNLWREDRLKSRNHEIIASSSQTHVKDDMIAGAFAGLTSRLVTAPLDLIKIRIQLQSSTDKKYKSVIDAFRIIARDEGKTAFWKGNLSATYLWISYSIIQFSTYSTIKSFGEDFIKRSSSSSHATDSGVLSCLSKTLIQFVAGAGAGISATVATYPFDIMRTQFVVQGSQKTYSTMTSFISSTFRSKGVKGLYAGVIPAVVGITPYMGLNFAIYESLKATVERPLREFISQRNGAGGVVGVIGNVFSNFFCGAVAGGTSKLIVYPLDTVKRKLQGQTLHMTYMATQSLHYRGMIDCCIQVYKNEGMRGFYKGLIPTTLKSFTATAVTFAAFEGAKDFLEWHRRDI